MTRSTYLATSAHNIFSFLLKKLPKNKCNTLYFYTLFKQQLDAMSTNNETYTTKFPSIDIYETMKYWMFIVQISTLTERTQRLQSYCWTFDALSENSCFELRCINPAILQLSIICQGISLYKDNKVMHSW